MINLHAMQLITNHHQSLSSKKKLRRTLPFQVTKTSQPIPLPKPIIHLFFIYLVLDLLWVMADSINSPVLKFLWFFIVLILVVKPKIVPVLAQDDDGSGVSLDSCNEDLSIFLPVPFGNLTNMRCERIWNTFVLRFSQNEDHIVNVVLSAEYTNGWVGMGFSKDGTMVGSSAMVGWIRNTGRGTIKQYYLRGYSSSEVIANKGEMPLTNIPPAVVLFESKIYLAFQLKFTYRLTKQATILAFGVGTPSHNKLPTHEDKTTIWFDFSRGTQDMTPQNGTAGTTIITPPNISKMRKSHGALALIGWGIMLPIGSILARYFRHCVVQWYYVHAFIQLVGFLIGLAAVVSGKVLYDKVQIHDIAAHRGIGIFIFVLTILQVLALFLRPDKDSKIRQYWNWYHHWVGRLVLVLGATNIIVGATRENTDHFYFPLAISILTVIFTVCVILEVVRWLGGGITKHDIPDQKTQHELSIETEMNRF